VTVVAVVVWTGFVFARACGQVDGLQSRWAYDLAYFNQWFFNHLHDLSVLTVRPSGNFEMEGPELWRTNHFQPIRYLLLPLYAVRPGVGTLLMLQTAALALGAFAARGIVVARTRDEWAGLAAVALYLSVPFSLGFALNDFRILHLAVPLALACHYFAFERPSLLGFAVTAALLLQVREELVAFVAYFGCLATVAAIRGSKGSVGHARGWLAARPWAVTTAALVLVQLLWLAAYRHAADQSSVGSLAGEVATHFADLVGNARGATSGAIAFYGICGALSLLSPVRAAPGWLALVLLFPRPLSGYFGHQLHYTVFLSVFAAPAAMVGLSRVHGFLSARVRGTSTAWITIVVVGLACGELVRSFCIVPPLADTGEDVPAVHEFVAQAGDAPVIAHAELAAVFSCRTELYVYDQMFLPLAGAVASSEYAVLAVEDLDGPALAGSPLVRWDEVRRTDGWVFLRKPRVGR
jgi:uncharacterized membrane protein